MQNVPRLAVDGLATMAKKSKATKKFEKNRLKDTLERRKDFAKAKQRHRLNEKRKGKAAKRADDKIDDVDDVDGKAQSPSENMDADEYFKSSLDILDKGKPKKTQKSTGKRKRDSESPAAEVTEEESSGSEEAESGLESGDDSDDVTTHKDQISALAEKDPEFYKFLQDNDAELLEFDADDDLLGVDALSESEDGTRPQKKAKAKAAKDKDDVSTDTKVTKDLVQKWRKAMNEQHSIRATRQVVLAFRAAAHLNDAEEQGSKFEITSADVYHEILTIALKEVPTVLQHHIPVKENVAGKIRVPTDTPKFKTLSPLIKSYTSTIHYLLNSLSDAATMRITLQSLEPLTPYLLQFRKFLKVIIKTLVGIWSDGSNNEATRISSFLIIRRLMVISDPGLREAVLKSVYEGIVKGSRNTTLHTLAGINLMKNSAAELWGIDQKVGYTTGFNFIRQLAMHLRTNVTKPTKDSYKTIYNWQYVHSLDFWSRVLATHCNSLVEAQNGKESQLRPLIYPAVQITLGVMRLIPTATYFPLRFQLIRSLLRLSQSTETFIPLASPLIEVLNSTEMKKPPKPSTLRPLDFSLNYRTPQSYLRTRVYQDNVGDQVIELLSEFLVLWSKSIAFPELQLPVVVMLKRWLRSTNSRTTGNKNSKLNQAVLLLIQKLESNARWIEERRNKVTFSPRDRAEVDAFLKEEKWENTPLGAFVVGQRKMREERKNVLEEGRKDEERRRKQDKESKDVDMENGEQSEDEEVSEDEESS